MTAQRIDILQEFVDLSAHEEMLAFFAFHLDRAGAEPLAGLCRISKPKHGAHMQYLSLTFLIDTLDDATRTAADAMLTCIESAAFKAALPAVAEVVRVPAMTADSENYVQELDLMFNGQVDPDESFVRVRLLPALQTVTGFQAEEVVWWQEAAQSAGEAPATDGAPPTLLGGIKQYVQTHLEGRTKK